jgi:hypothetical protein
MKMTLFVLCLLFATAAFGQTGGAPLNALEFADHSARASFQSMSQTNDILGGSSVVIAHGEVPLADIPLPEIHETPLGDVARQLKKDHLTAKKAQRVWESQIFSDNVAQVVR